MAANDRRMGEELPPPPPTTTPHRSRHQSLQEPYQTESNPKKLQAKPSPQSSSWVRSNCFSPVPSTSFSGALVDSIDHNPPDHRTGGLHTPRGKLGMGSSPLTFYSDDAIQEVCSGANRCRPRGPFSGLVSSFFTCWLPVGDASESKSWAKGRAAALLELSKRQQSALLDKQEAIDLLQWKLQQLQATDCMKPGQQAANAPHAKTTSVHEKHNLRIDSCSETSASSSSSYRFPESSEEESQPAILTTTMRDQSSTIQNQSSAVNIREFLAKERSVSHDSEELLQITQLHMTPATVTPDVNLSERDRLFEMGVIRARVAVRYFCKLFMKQMEISGYSVWRTLQAIDPDATFSKHEHTAYALESNLNKAMYHCFENDSFDDTGLTLIIDPNKRCEARFAEFQRMRLVDAVDAANLKHRDFEPKFLAFCERKMREMWFLFPWNIVFKDAEERKLFTGAFLDAAKCIWLLHRLAFSLQPVATILRVGKGMEINPLYVETIVPSTTGCEKCGVAKVQFMTMPGFQVNHTVIRCQVYQHLQCR
ncbi:unnamed protein product [Sphagnum jensenii]|uniref:GIL1/IRKI C-terminal domain-containing protein n=1 Tax=Sphagnum jensenii TaxID=128206 RepID=A0ABP0W1J9_9BRYO